MSEPEALVADVVAAAGNRIVGRVRLQKIIYLLDQLGLNSGFDYSYHHYGPYSADLADAVEFAKAFDLIAEKIDYRKSDGVPFSIFEGVRSPDETQSLKNSEIKSALQVIQKYSATVLELAATIHWLLHAEKVPNWEAELKRRKGAKTGQGRMQQAIELLREIGFSTI